MKESDLRSKVTALLRTRGARPIKYYGCAYSEAGIPDILAPYRGRFLFLETKLPGNKPTPIQSRVMSQLAAPRAEAIGGTVYSVEDAAYYLDLIDAMVDGSLFPTPPPPHT